MTSKTSTATPAGTNVPTVTRSGRLFLLELSGDRIHSMKPDGSDRKTIVTNCHLPMASSWMRRPVTSTGPTWASPISTTARSSAPTSTRKVIVPQGITHTPKQLHLDKKNGKLYWGDREGMRVMRANRDGSQVETLVETGHGDKDAQDQRRWCVGITVDPKLGKIYWTQKGPDNGEQGRILRAGIDLPKGESPANRSDIEVLFDCLPEPIDLEIDLLNRVL